MPRRGRPEMQIGLRFFDYRLPLVALTLAIAACSGPSSSIASSDAPLTAPAAATPVVTPAATELCQAEPLPISAQTTLGGQRFELEVAQTSEEQQLGLMCRDALPANRGMVFPFEPARPVSFWMFRVRFPLDIVFIRDQVVVGIAANVPGCSQQPCPSYGPGRDVAVDVVLELNGGQAAALGLAVGDRVTLERL